ncbi:MAG: protein kinase [Myxococcales bacterium]|nr:protein kinase [Myxococcales bacterium]
MGKVGDLVANRFRLGARVSEGGMAYIVRAEDTRSGRPVAVKMLKLADADTIVRFEREAAVLEMLRHPNVVEHVAHGIEDEKPYLVLEWLEGCDLRSRLDEGPLDTSAAVDVVGAVARALVAAHPLGVVHRDIKPENVFLVGGDTGRAKLLDFGIARTAGSSQTSTGMVMGTPHYMAPEQATGEATTPATDLWALGVLLFECLTGQKPFVGDNVPAILTKVAFAPAPSVADVTTHVPDALVQLCADLLEKDPKNRPSAAEVHDRLQPEAPPSLRQSVRRPIGRAERTSACVLITGIPERVDGEPRRFRTRRSTGAEVMPVQLEHGGYALVLVRDGEAVDLAARAARRALALREDLGPSVPIAIVTTRLAARAEVGAAIESAARLVSADVPGIVLDEATAALLEGRFDLASRDGRAHLIGERGTAETSRLLLGKVAPFVGRDNELAMLESLYEECTDEPESARAVLVTAGAGAGKSRLFRELTRRFSLLSKPPIVWAAKGDPDKAGSPFALVEALTRQALRCPESLPRGEQLATVIELAAGPMAATPVTERALLSLLRLLDDSDYRPSADEICAAWIEVVRALARGRPLVLGFDDLQWSDRPSILAIERLLAAARVAPLFCVGLARADDGEGLVEAFAKRAAMHLELRSLRPKPVEALARAALGESASKEAVAFIVSHGQGNAFLVEELIRACARGEQTLPESAVAVAEARLDTLTPEVRRVFRAATIFGETSWASAVGSLVADPGLDRALATLIEQELLTERPSSRFPGERELAIRHALLREAGYATLSADDRLRGHAGAFAWLRDKGETSALVLAAHAERGGRGDEAAAFLRQAAREALFASDHRGALDLAARGLRSGGSREERAALHLVEAETHTLLQDAPRGCRAAEAVLRQADVGSVAWYGAMACLVAAAHRSTDVDEASRLFLAIDETARQTLPVGAVPALLRAARSLVIVDLIHESTALAELAASVTSKSPQLLGPLRQLQSLTAVAEGRLDVALACSEEAVAAHTEAGNLAAADYCFHEITVVLTRLGRFDEAEAVYEVAVRRSSVPDTIRQSLLENLAYTKILARRDLAEARDLACRAGEHRARLSDVRYVVACCVLAARASILDGDPAWAREHLLSRQLEAEEQPAFLGLWLATLADAERLAGDPAVAAGHAEAAEHELDARRSGIELSPIFARTAIVEAYAAAARFDAAKRAARRLAEMTERDASLLEREADRARFLAVPDNADARAVAARYA